MNQKKSLVEAAVERIKLVHANRALAAPLQPGDAYKILPGLVKPRETMDITIDAWFVIKKIVGPTVEYVVVDQAGRTIEGPFKTKRNTFENVLHKSAKKDSVFYTQDIV